MNSELLVNIICEPSLQTLLSKVQPLITVPVELINNAPPCALLFSARLLMNVELIICKSAPSTLTAAPNVLVTPPLSLKVQLFITPLTPDHTTGLVR